MILIRGKMNYIVLVKQVPDIKNIPEDAWDREKGTLKRGLLDNVCNELDMECERHLTAGFTGL